MAARKISISMEEDLLDLVAQAAEEAGMTVSGWLAELAREQIALLGWRGLIDDVEAEHGAFTAEEMDEARAAFAAAGFRRPRPPAETQQAS